MLAVRGIYDGEVVKLLEPVGVKKKAEVIVTFLDTLRVRKRDDAKATEEFLKICGTWEDNRIPDKIIRDIYLSRKSTCRLEQGL